MKITSDRVGEQNRGLRLHLTDGSAVDYILSDTEQTMSHLEQLQPNAVFTHPKFVIAGSLSVTGYLTANIVKIDFTGSTIHRWAFPESILHVSEITPDQFENRIVGDASGPPERENQSLVTGDLFLLFLDLHMVTGQHIYLALEGAVSLPVERIMRLQNLFFAPSIHARIGSGGNTIINLSKMISFTAWPGPPEVPADAWSAERADSRVLV